MFTEKYGSDLSQEGDFFIPDGKPLALFCLFHGGFWLMPYGRDQMTAVAQKLVQKGFAVWNVGYRRIGEKGGAWPGTFEDAVASINHVHHLFKTYRIPNDTKVVLIGHSAGGQLAIWAGKQNELDKPIHTALQIKSDLIVGLAPAIDLVKTFEERLGNQSVLHLLKGTPDEIPERYALYDPMQFTPIRIPQLVIHGKDDDVLSVQWSRNYVERMQSAGTSIELIEIAGGGHMDFIDPNSSAITAMTDFMIKRYSK
ncbi:alpha/beta hydrolase [bacterium]|nr:alpha/beta hydrolase [bacterium]